MRDQRTYFSKHRDYIILYRDALKWHKSMHKHGNALSEPDDVLASIEAALDGGVVLMVNEMLDVIGGCAIVDGDIQGLFAASGYGSAVVKAAIAYGGCMLDCFDGFLPEFYKQFGFEEYMREPNWTAGEPDVVYMALPVTYL